MTKESKNSRQNHISTKAVVVVTVASTLLGLMFTGQYVAWIVAFVLGSLLLVSYLPCPQVPASWRGPRELVRISGFMLLCIVLFMHAVERGKEGARQSQCRNNMKRIVRALKSYHVEFGCFPSVYIADETGKPMHSWRVLLLPYLDEKSLYAKYDFTEPWDGPNNSQLGRAGDVYACPTDYRDFQYWEKPYETSYIAVVGNGTLWSDSASFLSKEFDVGLRDTIVIVEVANSGILWLEPRDLSINQMNFEINDWVRLGIRSQHRGGANVALAGGTVRFLDRSHSGDLKKLLRVDQSYSD